MYFPRGVFDMLLNCQICANLWKFCKILAKMRSLQLRSRLTVNPWDAHKAQLRQNSPQGAVWENKDVFLWHDLHFDNFIDDFMCLDYKIHHCYFCHKSKSNVFHWGPSLSLGSWLKPLHENNSAFPAHFNGDTTHYISILEILQLWKKATGPCWCISWKQCWRSKRRWNMVLKCYWNEIWQEKTSIHHWPLCGASTPREWIKGVGTFNGEPK